jgi:hypothetical protein
MTSDRRWKIPDETRARLESEYRANKFPTATDRERIAQMCNTTTRRVHVYFQNRRQREKDSAVTTPCANKRPADVLKFVDEVTDLDIPNVEVTPAVEDLFASDEQLTFGSDAQTIERSDAASIVRDFTVK